MKFDTSTCLEVFSALNAQCKQYFFIIISFLFICFSAAGQEDQPFDEVPISFNVTRLGSTELLALIRNDQAFLPVKEVFDYLKINNKTSAQLDSVTGFFISRDKSYVIDHSKSVIIYSGKSFAILPADMILSETGLYLKITVFGQVFGLNCDFSFRNLYVTLKPQVEIPAIREMQLEQLRRNLTQLKGEKKADTTLKNEFKLAELGMVDWSVTNMQETKSPSNTRINLALGATLLGAEAEANLNIYSDQPFDSRQQSFRWKYVNNKFAPLRQIMAGRIFTPTVTSIFAPVNGVQLTNTPTSYRKSFGTYRYTGSTQPGWVVELYVNNVLIDYQKADASGFYAFDIPMLYGNSSVRLKFFGAWGEESTKEENIHIPFNFLPTGEFQYALNAGIVADGQQSRFSRLEAQYGLSKRVTVGGGYEYLSALATGKVMPFLNSSVRLGQSMIFTGEYMHGVRSKGTLNYRPAMGIQVDATMIKYDREQIATWNKYLQERKLAVTMPFRIRKINTFSRISLNQYIYFKSRSTDAEVLFSSVIGTVSSSMRTFAQFNSSTSPSIFSNLSLAFRLPADVRLIPQVQYQFGQSKFTLLKIETEKRISYRGFLNLTYENNPAAGSTHVTLGLRYNLSFAQTLFSARVGKGVTTTTQHARGSLMYNHKAAYADLGNQSSVGRSGLIVSPFLDINCNGLREPNEPKVDGLNLRVNGGRVQKNDRDTTLLILNLESYADYLIEMDVSGFDNIAWKLKHSSMKVTAEPNRLKLVQVPVGVMGEASGMVYLHDGRNKKGISRIIVNFYDTTGNRVAQVLTENDGYFNFIGLSPGSYLAKLDSGQLVTLNLHGSPASIAFTVKGSEEGAIADNFEFVLKSSSSNDTNIDGYIDTIESIEKLKEVKGRTNIPDRKSQPLGGTRTVSGDTLVKGKTHNVGPARHNSGMNTPKLKARPTNSDKKPKETRSADIIRKSTLKSSSGADTRLKNKATKTNSRSNVPVNKKAEKKKSTSDRQRDQERQQLEMQQRLNKQKPQKNPYEKWIRPFKIIEYPTME